jgi:hypothetical protein
MIQIISSPALNRVLLDANNTEIIIKSSNGNGYYFRAVIYIDDVLFDEQGWSRKNTNTAVKDLVKLYNAYFETIFIPFSINGIVPQTHLKKKVTIIIQERNLNTDAIIDTVTLPSFFLMYNATPVYFDDRKKIQLLGVTPEVLQISSTGKIIIPFYTNVSKESVSVEVTDNFGNILYLQSAPPLSGQVFLFSFDLSGVKLANNTTFFETKISCGDTVIVQRYRLFKFPNFGIKELFFKNNFGYYTPAYFDGELEVVNDFKIEEYKQADGTSVIFEITEGVNYTVNTGYLLSDERAIINQINNSLEVWYKEGADWLSIQTKTKKETEYKDRRNSYSEKLIFSRQKGGRVSNKYKDSEVPDWESSDWADNDFLT